MEANRQGDLLYDYQGGEDDWGMIYDLHPRDRNEPPIVLVTFLGEWDPSNKLDDVYGKETGDGRQFVVSGCGERWHLGCYLAVIETPDLYTNGVI